MDEDLKYEIENLIRKYKILSLNSNSESDKEFISKSQLKEGFNYRFFKK